MLVKRYILVRNTNHDNIVLINTADLAKIEVSQQFSNTISRGQLIDVNDAIILDRDKTGLNVV